MPGVEGVAFEPVEQRLARIGPGMWGTVVGVVGFSTCPMQQA